MRAQNNNTISTSTKTTSSSTPTTTEASSNATTAPPFLNEFISAKQKKKQILASGYTQGKRNMEIACVTIFSSLLLINFYLISPYLNLRNALTIVSASACGMLIADFISGVVHWAADTWGTVQWPIVGTFIRSFREHHVDPAAMTKHDAIETNGDNCLISILFCLAPHLSCSNTNLLTIITGSAHQELTSLQLFSMFMWTFLGIFGALTNQFHKWAHMYKVPYVVSLLQDYHIILSRKSHNEHHKSPFDCSYCITTGWLNPFLDYIDFWTYMEKVISATTGLVPRQDDASWNDHLALLEKKVQQEREAMEHQDN